MGYSLLMNLVNRVFQRHPEIQRLEPQDAHPIEQVAIQAIFQTEKPQQVSSSAPPVLPPPQFIEAKAAPDYKKMTDQSFEAVINKTTLLTMVHLMDAKISDSLALEIVQQATTSTHSLYEVFCQRNAKGLTLLGKCKYFLFYYLGILPNAMKTLLAPFLSEIRLHLIYNQNKDHVPQLVDQVLAKAGVFLEDLLENRISVPEIEPFSKTLVRRFIPTMPLLQKWKQSPYLLIRLFAAIIAYLPEKLLRFLLQRALEEKIPELLNSLNKENLPFATSLTQGIADQLQEIRLTQGENAKNLNIELKNLPQVIKRLLDVINRELQLNEQWSIASYTLARNQIENAFINMSQSGFNALLNPEKSEELLYQIVDLADHAFDPSDPIAEEDFLKAERAMHIEAKELFRTIINKEIPISSGNLFVLGSLLFKPIMALFPHWAFVAFPFMMAARGLAEDGLVGEAEKIFNAVYGILLKPPLWKWVVSEGMSLVNRAYKEETKDLNYNQLFYLRNTVYQ